MLTTSLNAGINLTCAGARAAGMGGAFIGVTDDATAISWNPGNLVKQYLKKIMKNFLGRLWKWKI